MQSRLPAVVAVVGALLLSSTAAVAKTFKIDQAHTNVMFRVSHLFSTVTGRFTDFDGQITFDDGKPLETKVVGSIVAASINTDNEKRDKHLRSADFFDVEKFPTITFFADKVTDVDQGAHKAKLHGTLTMHGVSRPIVLEGQFLGAGKDPWGNSKAGFRGTTRLNRKDFGLSWNQALETGGVLVGEEIEIVIDVEAGATE